MKEKSVRSDNLEVTNPETDIEFISDSLEQIQNSALRIGYDDVLAQAFQAAIARAKSELNSCFKYE